MPAANMRNLSVSSLLAAAIALSACSGPPEGYVDDRAGILDPQGRAQIEAFHGFLLRDHDIDYQLVTTRDGGNIERFAVTAFEERATGQRSTTGRGLLMVVDAAQDLVRLEVSPALEGVFLDAFVAYLEQRQMVPFFEKARLADGILAATELIVSRAQNARANAGFDGEAWTALASGAGATSKARIGADSDTTWRDRPANVTPSAGSPSEVVSAYLAAMAARNANPQQPIYSIASRDMLGKWVVTPAQMDNIARTYARCRPEAARIEGSRAVVRYAPTERSCAPWFLVSEDGQWRLDLTMMQGTVRFGRSNAWRFARTDHPYAFAFADWAFDQHGFPRVGR